jgi:hypothetical protein
VLVVVGVAVVVCELVVLAEVVGLVLDEVVEAVLGGVVVAVLEGVLDAALDDVVDAALDDAVEVVEVVVVGGGGAPAVGGSVEAFGPVTSAPFFAGSVTKAEESGV